MKKRKKKKIKLSPEELEKRNHRADVRSIFLKSGFKRVPGVSDKEFSFNGRPGDIDDVFINENIIILAEYTCSKSSNISTHLLKKKIIFDHIVNNSEDFIDFFESQFFSFKESRDQFYNSSQCKVVIIYCSKNDVEQSYKDQVNKIKYLDYPVLRYFKNITGLIRQSSRFELFKFLELKLQDVGKGYIQSGSINQDVNGTILPEEFSHFKKGYKVVSFYIDPATLLRKSYVLRKDGWSEDHGLYQRMIIGKKIKAIRKYLHEEKRVFINNIIVTLPFETKLKDSNGNTVDPGTIRKTTPVTIQIPEDFNVIGLIDGQHRVYAYHEGGIYEPEIKLLREKQNLLVTGIIYPKTISQADKTKFEAKLFLEINSNQANAKSELKQAIGVILKPFSSESIAKVTIGKLNQRGPLENQFEEYFFDKDKIKTTSIVSYALKPMVKLSGNDSFYYLWSNSQKNDLKKESDQELLKTYIDYCVRNINYFFTAVKINVDHSKWTTDKKIKNKILTTTAINGLLICLRKLIEADKTGTQQFYESKLKDIGNYNFNRFKSSQYAALARDLFERYFN